MDKVEVIGIIGKAGAGKTTAAQYLALEQEYTRLRVADGLKKMLRDGLGIAEEYIDGNMKEASCPELCGVTARHAMITLGTEWGREMIHPNIWVKAIDTKMRELIRRGHRKFVIDDIRFLNEVEWIAGLKTQFNRHSFEGRLIRIVRKDKVSTSVHQSEMEQEQIVEEATIYNDGSIAMLQESIWNVISRRYHNIGQ